MPTYSEEQLAELIALTAPPPEAWVRAATELPQARSVVDELITRATADRRLREAILADLEEALRGSGVEPRPELVESLRARLSEPG